MKPPEPGRVATRLAAAASLARKPSIVAIVAAIAALHFARDVLIPVALAVLLTFVLAPAAHRLERFGAGRVLSTALVAVLAFAILASIGWVATGQAVSLVAKLPEYRANITKKIRALKRQPAGELGKAAEAVKDLQKEAVPDKAPLAVKETPDSPLAQLVEFVAPFAKPVGMALAVIVFTILLLVSRENMRERLVALMGATRINVTTQALGEASERVSSYLLMQLLVNTCFGVPFGIALWLIGVPGAVLWGLLGIALRFIPYVGVWIAVALPALLAFAISNDWTLVAWTIGVFLALELVLTYAVEPWLYGRSTGLSPLAVMAAAVFWTWLWGPLGLLLSTPLTVCIAVLGRYIPQFGVLHLMLAAEPALAPEARVYQRLLAGDSQEAAQVAREFAEREGEEALFEQMLIPALALAERDRSDDALEPSRARAVFEGMQRIIDSQRGAAVPPLERSPVVCIAAAHDEADWLVGRMLGRLLPSPEFAVRVLPHPLLAAELAELVDASGCRVVVISALQLLAESHADYLCRRFRQRFPEVKIVVGLWGSEDDAEEAQRHLKAAGADEVVTNLGAAVERVRQHAPFGVEPSIASATTAPRRSSP